MSLLDFTDSTQKVRAADHALSVTRAPGNVWACGACREVAQYPCAQPNEETLCTACGRAGRLRRTFTPTEGDNR